LIEPLRAADESRAVSVLAAAFRDNPLNRAVIRSDDPDRRLRSNEYGMRSLIPTARVHGRVLVARDGGELSGALVASPPGRFPLPSPGIVSRLRVVIGQGWSVATRWGDVFVALEALHPREPHWYLGTLGVAPDKQRRGLGLALLREWLQGVDRDGVGAYLETDTERNVGFYGTVGFELEGEIEVLGAPIWRMRRLPAATGAPATQ